MIKRLEPVNIPHRRIKLVNASILQSGKRVLRGLLMSVLLWLSVFAARIDRSTRSGRKDAVDSGRGYAGEVLNQSIINANTRTGAIEITLEQGRIRSQHLVLRYQ